MPETGVQKKQHMQIMTFEEVEDIVRAGVGMGITKVRLTGGEPLVRRGIVSLVEQLHRIDGLSDMAMTTNGLLLADHADALARAGLNRVNISLDTLKKDRYAHITRGGDIDRVWQGIDAAKAAGLSPIKINAVLVGGFNDDEIEDFVYWTRDDDIEVRFIELMPVGQCAMDFSDEKSVPGDEVLRRVPELKPLDDPHEKVSVTYRLPGGKGKVGLINPMNHKFCDRCNRLRITADAKIKPCLHSNDEIDIRQMHADGYSYEQILTAAAEAKPKMHHLDACEYTSRNMNKIGG
jgi:cyclic pyranopterin phosphate synthase